MLRLVQERNGMWTRLIIDDEGTMYCDIKQATQEEVEAIIVSLDGEATLLYNDYSPLVCWQIP